MTVLVVEIESNELISLFVTLAIGHHPCWKVWAGSWHTHMLICGWEFLGSDHQLYVQTSATEYPACKCPIENYNVDQWKYTKCLFLSICMTVKTHRIYGHWLVMSCWRSKRSFVFSLVYFTGKKIREFPSFPPEFNAFNNERGGKCFSQK